jgi:folate-binding protein YgfZ
MADHPDPYLAVHTGVGLCDRSGRARLEILGPDRAKFLHNLTTNDVNGLAAGRGMEAFVTSPQGKTLGYVTLLARPDRILLRTDAGGLEHVLPHLRKYGVFDDVALDDVGARTCELHLAGPLAQELVARCGADLPAVEDLSHVETRIAGRPVLVVREAPTGRPGLTLIGDVSDAEALADALGREGGPSGIVAVSPKVFDVLRIEAGTPVFGLDVTPENLPQELGREGRTIHFQKGCYLGQETVARIDALGHVNKVLRGLLFPTGPVPPGGTPLEADGKKVGAVTSAADSPGWGAPVALAYVRAAQAAEGNTLHATFPGTATTTTATIVPLPMLPPAKECSGDHPEC